MNTIPNVQKYSDRTSFVLKKDTSNAVCILSDKSAGIIAKSIFNFVNNKEVLIDDPIIFEIFLNIANNIVSEWEKYNPKTEKHHWNYQGGITEVNHAKTAGN